MVSAERRRTDWRYLPLILVLAYGLRLAVALATDTLAHPDEVFQYLEPAHRLVFGSGFVAWEYRYGLRSWIIPGALAGLLEALKAVGLDGPAAYQPAVKAALCLVSLSLPLSVYRITRACVDEAAARVALALAALWYELVYYAHKPLADDLCAYALYGALAVGLTARGARGRAAFGALAALAVALRFQLAPAAGLVMLVQVVRWRGRSLPALATFAGVTAASGLLDLYAWGVPFASIWLNIKLNLFSGMAATFGVAPPQFYVQTLAVTSLGLVFLGAVGLWLVRRTAWLLILVGLGSLVEFSMIGHKEPRFVFPLIPLYLIGLAALATRWRPAAEDPARAGPAFEAARLVPAATAIVSAAGLLWLLPFEHRVYERPLVARDDLRQAYRLLAATPGVAGVADASGVHWSHFGGYYDLNRPAPIYRPDLPWTRYAAVIADPGRYATHWLAPEGAAGPAGFRPWRTVGRIAIWRRVDGGSPVRAPAGYSARIDVAGLTMRPEVTPRW